MKTARAIGLTAAILLVVPAVAHAQRTGGAGSAPAPVMRSAAASVPARTAGYTRTSASRTRAATSALGPVGALDSTNFGGALTVQQLLDPFPGFGFNFEHLSAIDQDIAIKALIDPATQARLRIALRLSRLNGFAPGAFLLDGGGYYAVPTDNEQQPQAQQPVIIVQQAPQQPAPPEMAGAEPSPEAAPIPDEGEFTLVTRQGVQIDALAFTVMDDKIVYITPAGGRRSIAIDELDANATIHLNQERGTPIQLPELNPRNDPRT
ncbi:MAG TPA: hypothetical protein VEG64_00160 [Candidatus Sulfotelmatobacter sp.]|nr:hypothetical protein [Candidatus Sulfotelmatobacter sp.]